jgi:uncharacterized protein (DUF433 family)
MMKLEKYAHLTSKPGTCGGEPIVKGSRTSVRSIATYHNMGMSAAEIRESLPYLSLGQIHSALAYYFDHQRQVDRAIQRNQDIDFWRRWLKRRGIKAL